MCWSAVVETVTLRRRRDARVLTDLAEAEDPSTRAGAVRHAAQRWDGEVAAAVAGATDDPDPGVRRAALRALSDHLDDPDIPVLRTLARVAAADPDRQVRLAAVAALGPAGQPAIEPLCQLLLNETIATMREAIAEALDDAGWVPDTTRAGALYFVARRRWDWCVDCGQAAIEPLAGAARDAEEAVRLAAVRTLAAIGRQHPAAAGPLGAALVDESVAVRQAAVEAIGAIGEPDAATLLCPLLSDPDQSVSGAVTDALIALGPAAVEALAAVLGDTDPRVRRAAVEVLGAIGHETTAAPLCVTLGDTDPEVRQAAEGALTALGELAARPLRATLRDPTDHARRSAAAILERLAVLSAER
ncbi:MAG: HEAT repeat domain-containing protein [Micromonosporaceae bacterium]|nr:HEAT repeat domain-containing protein [Micromonosporaceae bacterium]